MDATKLTKALNMIAEYKARTAGAYADGLLDEATFKEELSMLSLHFRDALAELGLTARYAQNAATMQRYECDYRACSEGRMPDSAEGEAWLFVVATGEEASPEERAAYFDLAHEALIEIRRYEFPPADMPKPRRYVRTYGNGSRVIVPFACVDDGGLLACDNPCGKRFTLTSADGLHATIEVHKRAGDEYRPAWEPGSQFRGLIEVEGYTVDGLHSVGTVDIDEGQVQAVSYTNSTWIWRDDPCAEAVCTAEELACVSGDSVATQQGERNEDAFFCYPGWQAFFAWEREHPSTLLSPSFSDYVVALLSESGSRNRA